MKPFASVHYSALHRRLRSYKEEFLRKHFGRPHTTRLGQHRRWISIAGFCSPRANVIGVGFGAKITGGTRQDSPGVLRVYVRRKLPLKSVRITQRIPAAINGLATDVIEVGEVQNAMPAIGGFPGGDPIDPGTLGCLVQGRSTKDFYILSCFHVLADISNPVEGSPVYAGTVPIGKLYGWIGLDSNGGNNVDCGMASINNSADFVAGLNGIGPINPTPTIGYLQQLVMKSGREMPRITTGTVMDVSADVMTAYPESSQSYGFVQQIAIGGMPGPFAQRGDSGSVVIEAASKRPVGLLFAVGTDQQGTALAFANPIQSVIDRLNVDFV